MNNYNIKEIEGKFKVTEVVSDLIMTTAKTERKAVKLCRDLNNGAGFNGWTPPFFINTARKKAA